MGSDAAGVPAGGEPTTGAGPAAQPDGHGRSAAGRGPKLASVVVFVRDLDRAVDFYQELLLMGVAVRTPTAALLVGTDDTQMYLRVMGSGGEHPLGAIGVQYVIWTADSQDDLHRCEELLKERAAHVASRETGDGVTVVEGRDPDGLPLVIAYPGPHGASQQEIMARIYAW
ncbi:VOC family protein [Streptomyces cocklensis]|jgi:catechol 2,3-dioxygenase-like lactoylglutathione lyase family enzyme|uniref:Glyoxalase/Bleomycin resistance protein/Dioxygenase superfamily protein n=1 Tax=Actinacidiphila cocklensis TaxID=887465 RepID=A0A9W4GP54_9ACTN|nr:VOC family protein [Actinacidiphila cocklensis]MDD1061964.1 VOC family protein [Actinacidiphila cocklensis]WSX74707.1 VOC family protein [Streptomyces sp. NBC_00899]CAG6391244.1 Glyoxalase/Bleomycin resistance protein/Dioxygenase superfamily protein [Actinacidiphila cocklensis]